MITSGYSDPILKPLAATAWETDLVAVDADPVDVTVAVCVRTIVVGSIESVSTKCVDVEMMLVVAAARARSRMDGKASEISLVSEDNGDARAKRDDEDPKFIKEAMPQSLPNPKGLNEFPADVALLDGR